MIQQRKGQAAMEFLMTYGWAILAAIVVIAVLAIYFRPSTLVSGSTFVTAPFYAQASSVSASTGVNLELKNNGGEQLNVSNMALTVRTPSTGVTCAGALTNASTMTLEAGQTVVVTRACSGLSAGTTFSADIVVSYNKVGSTLAQTSTGTIAGSVTA
jgi:hypothetical protein